MIAPNVMQHSLIWPFQKPAERYRALQKTITKNTSHTKHNSDRSCLLWKPYFS